MCRRSYNISALDLSSFVFSPRNCGVCSREFLPHHTQITSLELIGCWYRQPPYKRRRQCKRVSDRSNWRRPIPLIWSADVLVRICFARKRAGVDARGPRSDSQMRAPAYSASLHACASLPLFSIIAAARWRAAVPSRSPSRTRARAGSAITMSSGLLAGALPERSSTRSRSRSGGSADRACLSDWPSHRHNARCLERISQRAKHR